MSQPSDATVCSSETLRGPWQSCRSQKRACCCFLLFLNMGYMLMALLPSVWKRSENGLKIKQSESSHFEQKIYSLHLLWKFTILKAYYATYIFRSFSDRFQSINFRENGLKTVWMFQIVLKPSAKVPSTCTPLNYWFNKERELEGVFISCGFPLTFGVLSLRLYSEKDARRRQQT